MEVYQTVSEWDGNYSTQLNNLETQTQPNTTNTTANDDRQTLQTHNKSNDTENGHSFDWNQSEMISSTKQNDVDNSHLAADKAVSDLSEEQLRDVLEQLTDHSLPDSEKCPLVRRLNAENASKEEPDLVISAFCKSSTISCRNSGRKSRYLHRTGSKDAEFVREKTSGKDKKVNSSQSLQDLLSTNSEYDSYSMRSIGATRNGKRLNKASRANSFTMPSGSQHFCTNTTNTTATATATTTPTASANNNIILNSNNNEMTDQTINRNSSNNNGVRIRSRNSKARPSSYISTSSVTTAVCANDSNNCDFESEVLLNASLTESPVSSLNYQECYATQSIHAEHESDNNHNMDCDNSSDVCNTAPEQHYSIDSEFIEMKDLRKKANIIEYSSEKQNNDCFESDSFSYKMHNNNKSYNNVDSFIDLGLTNATNSKNTIKTGIAERIVNHNNTEYDATDCNKSLQTYSGMDVNRSYNETTSSIPYPDSDLANFQQISPNSYKQQDLSAPTNVRDKKKKKLEPTKILAEHIEGHIGYKDIEYLTSYVNSSGNEQIKQTSSPDINKNNNSLLLNSNSSLKDASSGKKKERANVMSSYTLTKRKNVNNTSPNRNACGSDLNKNVSNIPLSTSTSSCSSDDSNNNKLSEIAQNTDSNTDENTSLLNSSSHVKDFASITRDNLDNLVENTQSFHLSNNMTAYSMRSNVNVDEHQYAASDGEMPNDRDIGFVVPKSKHFKRRKARRVDIYGNHCSPIASVQSSTSTTPPSSTFSGNGMFARGYESEREYNFESKYKQDVMRRKSTSSVCQSEQTSYNSDGELSSHSMPARNDNANSTRNTPHSRTNPSSIDSTPKASYADIAKSFNFGIGINSFLKSHNTFNTPLSVNTSGHYEEFPELDTSLTPVADVMPAFNAFNEISNSKIVEALVSPPPALIPEMRETDIINCCSAPTSSTNTPIPQNEYLLSESTENNKTESLKSEKLSAVPPVIMCDYLESVQLNDIGSVTFGFFEDLSIPQQTPDDCVNNEPEIVFNDNIYNDMAASHVKPSPESDESEHRISNRKLNDINTSYIDVDKKSFNYEHIISFIKRAWENARNDYQNSYQSTNEVNYRS